MTITVRPAEKRDVEGIIALHIETFEAHRIREPDFEGTPFIEKYLGSHLTRWPPNLRARTVIVAERDGAFVGHIAYHMELRPLWPRTVTIADVAVFPEKKGVGVSQALLTAVLVDAERRRAGVVRGYIWPGNRPSLAYARRNRFTLTPQPDGQSILVSKRLR
ncbi:GNAT family N-acetyltransferase [Maritimibacter sp. UBA3975]|uniref:GNAT family N-acetyltransferase n=1 Tax=Maritimibacter sp. UBA3975 TaxID=1946833 RepID=UPI0025B8E857|nr:GNAT family N-acetyltransferase [Maritimibacter sp. UBA3975]